MPVQSVMRCLSLLREFLFVVVAVALCATEYGFMARSRKEKQQDGESVHDSMCFWSFGALSLFAIRCYCVRWAGNGLRSGPPWHPVRPMEKRRGFVVIEMSPENSNQDSFPKELRGGTLRNVNISSEIDSKC